MPYEALTFYARMTTSLDAKCDSYTYSSTLKACAETRQLSVGKAIHCHILRTHLCPPSRIVCNSLLNMYVNCLDYNHNDLVHKVFDSMRRRNVVSWNTMTSWYVKTKRYTEALRLFVMMTKMGIKLTAVTFVNGFRAVSGMYDANIANMLYGLFLKMGAKYVNDVYAVSSAIFMYAELACLDFAIKTFYHSFEKNTEVWNTMIDAYIQNNHPIEALDLFCHALEFETTIVFDEVTFLLALTAASQLRQLNFAQQLHAYVTKTPFASCVLILNAIIVMYSRCSCIDLASNVFNGMEKRDVVSWNTMVSAFVQNGFDDDSLKLVYEMQRQGFMVDSVTVTALLSAASNLKSWELGKQTHAYLLRHGIEFEGMESYLIDMYAKSNLISTAQALFEQYGRLDRDKATWNAMIAGNTQNGQSEQAFIVFRQMLDQNVPPNAVTLASIFPSCASLGSMSLGKQLHGFSIRNFFYENVFVSSALVDMYSKIGALNCAETVFATTLEKNSVTYTNMILGYGQHGLGEKALELFHSMENCGIRPDAITIVAVLSACSYSGLVKEGLEIFRSIEREHKIRLLPEHCGCVVDMLGRVGRVAEAYELVKEMGEDDNMLRIWGSLLAACRIHGKFELGKIIANKLLKMEGNGMAGYHVLLSNIYAEGGDWKHVNKVRNEMQEKGLMKKIGYSWIDIAGSVSCFASGDRKHPQYEDLHKLLDELVAHMKDASYRSSLKPNVGWFSEAGMIDSF